MRGRFSRVNHVDTDGTDGTSRRQFLRRAGITAALTAAVAGGADLAGLTAASAKVRPAKGRKPSTCCVTALYEPDQCRPDGHACPSGECCFYLIYSECPGESDHYACLGGEGCKTFSQCA